MITDKKINKTEEVNKFSNQMIEKISHNIFDELGIYAYNSGGISQEYLLTHVIFHPVQKSLNRVIEIVYTIRVQLQ